MELSKHELEFLPRELETLSKLLGSTMTTDAVGVVLLARIKIKEKDQSISRLESENRKLKAELHFYERSQG